MLMPSLKPLVDAKGACLLVTIIATIFGGIVGYLAASNELSGTAIYQKDPTRPSSSPIPLPELVTRQSSPAKFHEATNFLWAVSGFSFLVSVISFAFYRRLDDCV